MKINYISDLHIDHTQESFSINDNIEKMVEWFSLVKDPDVLVIACDISNDLSYTYMLLDRSREALKRFNRIFLVSGNHDFCSRLDTVNTLAAKVQDIRIMVEELDIPDLVFLHNESQKKDFLTTNDVLAQYNISSRKLYTLLAEGKVTDVRSVTKRLWLRSEIEKI